jgi:single-stranded-DNA-specific exonuclease
MAQGSGRSIPIFHLLEALEAMPDLFGKFGGHRQAAGVTLSAAKVEEFRERLRMYAGKRLTPADFERELAIDAEIAGEEIDDDSVADILRLAPFGHGNPAPTFAARNVEIVGAPNIYPQEGTYKLRGKHLFLKLKVNFADRIGEFTAGTRMDLALQFEDDAYSAARGYAPWQAIVRDVRATAVAVT